MAVTEEQFKHAIEQAPIDNVKWWSGWKKTWHGLKWRGKNGNPVGLVLHHTAGASTESRNMDHSGNKCSADEGQAKYVNRIPTYNSPGSQFTIRRCGMLDVNTMNACYHGGSGDFSGTAWKGHGIPKDSVNSYMMGVELVSRGSVDDLTEAQWATLSELYYLLGNLYNWKDYETNIKYFTPRHKDWTSRKVDLKANRSRIEEQVKRYGQLWDGKAPKMVDIVRQREEGIAGAAVHRLAQRLHDLGYWGGGSVPERYVQKFPEKAWAKYQADVAPGMAEDQGGPGYHFYGHKGHDKIFRLPAGTTGPDGHLIDHDVDPAWHHDQ